MLREDAHFGGVELCRLRDPPQAENPAEQDSIFMTIEYSQSVHSIVVQWCARQCYWHKGLFCAILSERIV